MAPGPRPGYSQQPLVDGFSLDRITFVCFGASYLTALGLYLATQFSRSPWLRTGAIIFHAAGALAQSLFLAYHQPALFSPFGFFLFFSWLIALVTLQMDLASRVRSINLFALPVVLILVALAWLRATGGDDGAILLRDARGWGVVHAASLVLASLSLGFGAVAAVMYLVHARQLRNKHRPGSGVQLPSLEQLESKVRQSVAITFPLLTMGVLIGAGMLWGDAENLGGWTDPRVLGTSVLWLDLLVLVCLRYGFKVRGRLLAILVIIAFILLVVCAALPHSLPARWHAPAGVGS